MELKKTHITYGVITGLACIILGVIMKVTHLEYNKGAQWISILPIVIGLILNAIAFSKANDHYVTFGQVFGSSFKATALLTIILIVWSLATLFIWPETVDIAIQKAEEDMTKRGGLSEDQISQSLAMTRKYFKVFMVAGVLFGTLVIGAISSLLGAAIAKKKGVARPLS